MSHNEQKDISLGDLKNLLHMYDTCPYCQSIMQFSLGKYTPILNKNSVIFVLSDMTVEVDLNSNKINYHSNEYFNHESEDGDNYKSLSNYVPINRKSSLEFFGTTKRCEDCKRFYYMIQHTLEVNATEVKLHSYLQDVCFIYEDYQVCYDYIKKVTKLYWYDQLDQSVYKEGMESKIWEVPLLNLRVDNPIEVIDRVKKLTIFT